MNEKNERVELGCSIKKSEMKEEKRKLDDYDLINSIATADHCREIKHKFNTEELAGC